MAHEVLPGNRADVSTVRQLVDALQRRFRLLKEAAKIAAKAAAALQKPTAGQYFEYEVADGEFSFRVNEAQIASERRLEGRYFLFTNAARCDANDAVEAFFTLQEVERAFREMKDFLRLRPIYHWNDRRVRAHILVCVLAYL